jgi:hypothetical protein
VRPIGDGLEQIVLRPAGGQIIAANEPPGRCRTRSCRRASFSALVLIDRMVRIERPAVDADVGPKAVELDHPLRRTVTRLALFPPLDRRRAQARGGSDGAVASREAVAWVVSRIFRTFDQATASVCMSCG